MSNADLVTRGRALVPHCDDPSDYTEDDRTILAMADRIDALEGEVARLRDTLEYIAEYDWQKIAMHKGPEIALGFQESARAALLKEETP